MNRLDTDPTATGTDLTDAEALAALERFVVENDDLVELESEIGRFNVFDALAVVRQEIRHSNFLAWLLDPAESHGQGQLFLKAVLMDLLRRTPVGARPFSPVDLDGDDLEGVEVRREWRSIDLLIVAEHPSAVIAIENKIDAGEHSDQLARYERVVREAFPGKRHLFVFLTTDGVSASESSWTGYTYERIHAALSRALRLHEDSIGEEVRVFLKHYLSVIRSLLMSDPKIDELCQRIYKNHRQAIELMLARRPDSRSEIADRFTRLLKEEGGWYINNASRRNLFFFPLEWLDWMPPLADDLAQSDDPRMWLWLRLHLRERDASFHIVVYPTTDQSIVPVLLSRLKAEGSEAGFRIRARQDNPRRVRLYSERVLTDNDGIEPSDETHEKLVKAFRLLQTKLPAMSEQLRLIITEHMAEKS